MARFQPHLPTSPQSTSRTAFMSTYEQQGAWCLLFNKFIPKSELPHLGQVLYLQFRSPPAAPEKPPTTTKPKPKKGTLISLKQRRVGHACFSETCCLPMPILMTLSRFCLQVCLVLCDRPGSDAIRWAKPQLYICFSSFALRRLGFDVLLLRRLDGSNNGNSKKCQLDYCLRVGTSPGSFKGMFYWFCNCTVEWTNWTVPQGKESPCLNGICWMYALL